MSDGFLSQEEIDALLRGEPVTDDNGQDLTDIEKDALGEIGNISMGTAATTLSILLGRRVSITTPKVSMSTLNEIKEKFPLPYLIIEVGYTQGLAGTNILAIREQDALIISDLMMGGDGTNPPSELNELYMSAVTEAMNQMMGATATSISTVFKKKIDIAPPKVKVMDFSSDGTITDIIDNNEQIVQISFRMEVEDLIDSEIMQIVSLEVAKEMVSNLMGAVQPAVAATTVASAPQTHAFPNNTTAMPLQSSTPREPAYNQPMAATPSRQQNMQNVTVQPVQFTQLKPSMLPMGDTNIGLIMDVPMQVTVELGRTRKLIRDILELTAGSVVELDRLAGEPVDVLVNGKLIAKGEVVVIDEKFGVRVTEIVSQVERANNLQ